MRKRNIGYKGFGFLHLGLCGIVVLLVIVGDYKKGSLVGERVYFKEKPVEPTKHEEVPNDTEDVDAANQRNKKIEENPKTGVEAIPLVVVIVLLISSGLYFFVQKKYNRTFIKIK